VTATRTLPRSRLARLAQPSAPEPAPPVAAEERCDLCNDRIGEAHRHLLDLKDHRLLCVCQACRILFEQSAAGGGHLRLVPERRLRLDDLQLDDLQWAALAIPVDMAFFFHSTPAGRVVAFYPGPMGATESQLQLSAWEQLAAANPILRELAPDVEALLVKRARGAREHYVVPVDDCYRLAGVFRLRWKGLSGGAEVWEEIGRFFEELAGRAKPAPRTPREEHAWER
jgi:hypothetical protein